MREGIDIKKCNRAKPSASLSDAQKETIKEMFLGPYKKEWKGFNGIVDNTDSAIAERLGITMTLVSAHTERICKEHLNNVIKLRK
jgi:hypothetical protein